jgi:putative ABC transport system substrate-binding protein
MSFDRLRRREFMMLIGGAATWPVAARAQRAGPMRRVGVLMNGVATEVEPKTRLAALVQELRQLGWTEGQNISIDVRWNAGNAELARTYSAQLIGLVPDVILAASSTNLTVIREATSTVPVVFVQVTDPVEQGFVASMTKPGGNLTGFSGGEFSLGGKWLGLLKEIAPGLARVAIMFDPETSPQSKFFVPAVETAGQSLGVQAVTIPLHATADIEPAVERFAREPSGGLILPTDTFTRLNEKLIAELSMRHRLPMISANLESAKRGALMYYGATEGNTTNQWRQAATYIDRILKGGKPGDLPVQTADKFTLVINLKTAKALGLTVSNAMQLLADEVIE